MPRDRDTAFRGGGKAAGEEKKKPAQEGSQAGGLKKLREEFAELQERFIALEGRVSATESRLNEAQPAASPGATTG